MKITLCIDKQPKNNPSTELKKYEIEIGNRLCSSNDVYDELIIRLNDINKLEGIIKRRCTIDRFDVVTKLPEEIIQGLNIPEIMLFEGTNYIYIQEFNDLNMKIEYLTNVDMNKHFAKTSEVNASMTLTANEFNLQLTKKLDGKEFTHANIVAKINDDTSEAQIDADKVNIKANDVLDILAGNEINLYTKNISINSTNYKVDKNGNMICQNATINGSAIVNGKNFKVDKEGNATMSSATLTDGILKVGTKEIFNTNGVLSMFQYQCSGGEQNIGWLENYDMYSGNAYYMKKGLQILYNIPNDFTIVNAYVIFTHIPCKNEINVDGNTSYYDGYARNVRLYKLNNFSGLKYNRYGWNGLPDYSSLSKTEITNSSGTNVLNFTGSASASTSKTTINISSSLTKGSPQMLLIDTADTSVNGMADSLQKTAMGTATLFVIGYYKIN